ncbi:MAG: type I DNA topoisomerase [Mycoplasmatales bacterium]|nr:type I DNA topoisomerase [Mycoplasmatales bacterium]
MGKLVIVESPNKIKSIKKYLGDEYDVKASVGHIVYLPSSGVHRFGVDLETWKPAYKIDPKKADVVKQLRESAKKASEVFIATDPDREGEAIGDNIVTFLKLSDKYKRIRFNEITEKAVKKAISKPSELDSDLINAQIARRILDRIIGYKLSSLMRRKVQNSPSNPSAGRVQSIALKLVVEREKEIEAFVPVQYATADAIISENVSASLYFPDKKDNKTWIMPEEIEDIKSKFSGTLTVKSLNVSKRKDQKYTPFKQASLYKKADSVLGMSSSAVQSAMQRLYEGYSDGGLISYPRTDSTRLSSAFVQEARKYLISKYGKEYVSFEIKGVSGDQDAHEAIRPTSLSMTPEMARARFNISAQEFKVYKLIWTHTIQSLMNVPEREVLRYELEDNGLNFRMSTSKITFDGYFKVIGIPEIKSLPKMVEGEKLKIQEYNIEEHETKPPARYNDGSLIEKLDSIKVGRPSTFATTVKILKTREYVTLEGRAMKPTLFGRIVIDKLIDAFPKIINEQYTANLENQLDGIAEAKYDYKKILDDFWSGFEKEVDSATVSVEVTRMMSIKAGKLCPKSGHELLIKKNKRDGTTFFGCSNFPECTYTESDPNSKRVFRKKFFNNSNFKKNKK